MPFAFDGRPSIRGSDTAPLLRVLVLIRGAVHLA
jgi:hypothetical protein